MGTLCCISAFYRRAHTGVPFWKDAQAFHVPTNVITHVKINLFVFILSVQYLNLMNELYQIPQRIQSAAIYFFYRAIILFFGFSPMNMNLNLFC